MEVTRRSFVSLLIGAIGAAAAGVWCFTKNSTPARLFTRAIKPLRFPGTVRPLNDTAVQESARWGG